MITEKNTYGVQRAVGFCSDCTNLLQLLAAFIGKSDQFLRRRSKILAVCMEKSALNRTLIESVM